MYINIITYEKLSGVLLNILSSVYVLSYSKTHYAIVVKCDGSVYDVDRFITYVLMPISSTNNLFSMLVC